jgi:iron complex transport system ATP-binding protein
MTSAVVIGNVTVRAGVKTLIDDVSLSIEPGRIVALAGPNGAEKSTLLRTLSGEIAHVAGTIRLNGHDPRTMTPRDLALHRAVLSQNVNVTFPFTVREIVRMGAGERNGRSVEALTDRMLHEVDLDGFQDRIVGTLSGGEQQRVHFARVLVQLAAGEEARGPGVLLLDEPTASLDLRHQLDVNRIVQRRAGQGTTVIVVMHDLNLAAVLADCVAMLHRGRLAAYGAPDTVIVEDVVKSVFGISGAINRVPPQGAAFVLPHNAVPTLQARFLSPA